MYSEANLAEKMLNVHVIHLTKMPLMNGLRNVAPINDFI